ncbi:hypothetical protein [Pseudogulbenkiania sp. MAI-1]|nr:hypothetical protein [Pseudogulbenkiania sp. MAI-1]
MSNVDGGVPPALATGGDYSGGKRGSRKVGGSIGRSPTPSRSSSAW